MRVKLGKCEFPKTRSWHMRPMSNRRCFPNGVFCSEWCLSEGSQDPRGQKTPKCMETWGFAHCALPLTHIASAARQGQKSEKRCLETLF